MSFHRGHTIALLLATASLGVRKVTETEDMLVVEFGRPDEPRRPSLAYPEHYQPAPGKSRGPSSRRKYPVRR
jgi:hypothetical protein